MDGRGQITGGPESPDTSESELEKEKKRRGRERVGGEKVDDDEKEEMRCSVAISSVPHSQPPPIPTFEGERSAARQQLETQTEPRSQDSWVSVLHPVAFTDGAISPDELEDNSCFLTVGFNNRKEIAGPVGLRVCCSSL